MAVNAGYTTLDEVMKLMPSNDVFVAGEPRAVYGTLTFTFGGEGS